MSFKSSFLVFICVSIFVSATVSAETLNKAMVERVVAFSQSIEAANLNQKYPELKSLEGLPIHDSHWIRKIKASKAFPEIRRELKKHGFSGIEQYQSNMLKMMGAIALSNENAMAAMPSQEQMMANMKKQMEQMDLDSLPPEVRAEIKAQMKQSQQAIVNASGMAEAAKKHANAKDVAWAKENMAWFQNKMSEMNTGDDADYGEEDY